MSKSIKDYREAMDSVKISDSFYKRTETLLSELPETKLSSVSPTIKWVPTVLTAAAACFIFIFGVRLVLGSDENHAEIATETMILTHSETTIITETSPAASPLVDMPEEEDELEKILTETEQTEKEKAETEADRAKAEKEAEDKAKDKKTEADKAKDEKEDTGKNVTAETEQASSVTSAADIPEGSLSDSSENGDDGYVHEPGTEETYEEDEAAEAPVDSDATQYNTAGISEGKLLPQGAAYSSVNVAITPYFDMKGITSGKAAAYDGIDCRDVLDYISDAASRGKKTDTDVSSRGAKFRLDISEAETGKIILIVTVADGGYLMTEEPETGVRNAYALTGADREVLEHILFLRFASEEYYEDFIALN